jgi:hypothetical protein
MATLQLEKRLMRSYRKQAENFHNGMFIDLIIEPLPVFIGR